MQRWQAAQQQEPQPRSPSLPVCEATSVRAAANRNAVSYRGQSAACREHVGKYKVLLSERTFPSTGHNALYAFVLDPAFKIAMQSPGFAGDALPDPAEWLDGELPDLGSLLDQELDAAGVDALGLVEPLDHLLPQAQPAPRSSSGGDGSGSLFSNGAAGGSVARGSSGSEQGLSAEELKKEKLRAQNRQKQQRYRERQRVRGRGSVLTGSRASTTWVLRPALRLEIGSLSIIFCRRRRRSRLRSRWKARQLTWSGSGDRKSVV